MLQPKRVKYRRPQDGRGNKGNAHRGTQLAFGSFGIKTLEPKWIDSRQIEAARVAINRYMNREGQVWISIENHITVSWIVRLKSKQCSIYIIKICCFAVLIKIIR